LWSTVFRLISAGWLPHSQRFVRSYLCLKWRGFEPRLYRLAETRILLTWHLPDLTPWSFLFRLLRPTDSAAWDRAGATIRMRRVSGYPSVLTSWRCCVAAAGDAGVVETAHMIAQTKPHNSRATAMTAIL